MIAFKILFVATVALYCFYLGFRVACMLTPTKKVKPVKTKRRGRKFFRSSLSCRYRLYANKKYNRIAYFSAPAFMRTTRYPDYELVTRSNDEDD